MVRVLTNHIIIVIILSTMTNKDDILKYLSELTEPKMTDQQLADKLGIHKVSWLRLKSGRAPVSDKFLVRVDRVFPELGVFLPEIATVSCEDASNKQQFGLLNSLIKRFRK